MFVLEVVCADDACFFNGVAQGLFAVAVQAAIQRPIGDESVRMVRSAANHGIDVLLLEALAPIDVGFGFRELLGGGGDVLLVHITQGHDVLARDRAKMREGPAPCTDHGYIELVARCVGPGERAAG